MRTICGGVNNFISLLINFHNLHFVSVQREASCFTQNLSLARLPIKAAQHSSAEGSIYYDR